MADEPAQYVVDPTDAFRDDLHVWEGYFRVEINRYLGDVDLIRTLKKKSIDGFVGLFPKWRMENTTFENDIFAEHSVVAKGYLDMHVEFMLRIAGGDYGALFDSPIKSKYVRDLMRYLPDNMAYEVQLKEVARFLYSEHFRLTPCRNLSSRIYATVKKMVKEGAYQNEEQARQRLSGFFFDVEHIATYAPYCDGFIVDRAMSEIVAKPTVALTAQYGTRIFSLNDWDEFFAWLDEIERGISEEQSAALPLAYPWLAAK